MESGVVRVVGDARRCAPQFQHNKFSLSWRHNYEHAYRPAASTLPNMPSATTATIAPSGTPVTAICSTCCSESQQKIADLEAQVKLLTDKASAAGAIVPEPGLCSSAYCETCEPQENAVLTSTYSRQTCRPRGRTPPTQTIPAPRQPQRHELQIRRRLRPLHQRPISAPRTRAQPLLLLPGSAQTLHPRSSTGTRTGTRTRAARSRSADSARARAAHAAAAGGPDGADGRGDGGPERAAIPAGQ